MQVSNLVLCAVAREFTWIVHQMFPKFIYPGTFIIRQSIKTSGVIYGQRYRGANPAGRLGLLCPLSHN
jgi:hypothetical protein